MCVVECELRCGGCCSGQKLRMEGQPFSSYSPILVCSKLMFPLLNIISRPMRISLKGLYVHKLICLYTACKAQSNLPSHFIPDSSTPHFRWALSPVLTDHSFQTGRATCCDLRGTEKSLLVPRKTLTRVPGCQICPSNPYWTPVFREYGIKFQSEKILPDLWIFWS